MSNLKFTLRKNFLFILSIDLLLFTLAYLTAYLLRFDLEFTPQTAYIFFQTLPFIILIKFSVFFCLGLYQGMWRYTSLKDLENIIKASLLSTAANIIYILIVYRFEGYARSVFFIDGMLTIFFIGGVRMSIRLFYEYQKRGFVAPGNGKGDHDKKKKKIIIIGAGDAGEKILREINDNISLNYEVLGFLDDDKGKIHKKIHGIKVLDKIEGISSLPQKFDCNEVLIAIPSLSGERLRRIIDLCNKTGLNYKTLPGMGELIDGKVTVSKIREVSYEDLLGRDQVELEVEKIGAYLKGKSVLVTGAGGSIGSELCRQVARFDPEVIIMLDRAESDLYNIEMEMRRCCPKQIAVPILGSVTCLERIKKVFTQLEPDVVFHAAAYKHVPMMESHPWEAVYNNIVGTKNLLDVSLASRAERFILVSTDKAVRPTNIMGATKRVAEIIVQLNSHEGCKKIIDLRGKPFQTKMMAVRFGNVVGSAGSVIPLFEKQIAHGGPVTVTHKEVTRFFMTIIEAVQLILQAGAMGKSGEIFILKMGKPVKIIDMAMDLIRLSGFEPDKDIRIEITGLRPGEKLYEELISEGEGIVPTEHDKLLVLRNNGNLSQSLTVDLLEKKINELIDLADMHAEELIKQKLKEIVPEYVYEDSWKSDMSKCLVEKM